MSKAILILKDMRLMIVYVTIAFAVGLGLHPYLGVALVAFAVWHNMKS